ncbi:hypothetical protein C8R46DRAFT_372852 [Mycena filopes]|nr:hypothetical protein C8R46DRAFT_372852 [Mycena filopes]
MDFDDENLPAPELNDPAFTSIFPNAQHFTVAGGVFTTNNYVAPPTLPPAFRMIPWGDIDLQQNLGESGVVGYRRERNCVRRVYSAKVDGRTSDMTVAVYQGDGAEEDWRRDVAAYVSMRHPNIIQICAGATYGNIHATVFHGDLVPFKQYMAGPLPPVVRVYSYAVFASEWKEAQNYLRSANTPSYLPEEEEGDRVDVASPRPAYELCALKSFSRLGIAHFGYAPPLVDFPLILSPQTTTMAESF